MSAKLAVLKAAVEQLAGLGRRVVPMAESKVLKRIAANADDIAKSIAEHGGVSFSPRLNRILTPEDYGHMMAVVKEQDWSRLPVNKADLADIANRVVEVAKQPGLMKRLQRGENLGGWIDDSSMLAMDPSVRHLSRDVSILRGAKAAQDAGFSLMGSQQYDLTEQLRQEALRRLLAEAAVGGGSLTTGLTGGYLSER